MYLRTSILQLPVLKLPGAGKRSNISSISVDLHPAQIPLNGKS
jgi:hypothetical protein